MQTQWNRESPRRESVPLERSFLIRKRGKLFVRRIEMGDVSWQRVHGDDAVPCMASDSSGTASARGCCFPRAALLCGVELRLKWRPRRAFGGDIRGR